MCTYQETCELRQCIKACDNLSKDMLLSHSQGGVSQNYFFDHGTEIKVVFLELLQLDKHFWILLASWCRVFSGFESVDASHPLLPSWLPPTISDWVMLSATSCVAVPHDQVSSYSFTSSNAVKDNWPQEIGHFTKVGSFNLGKPSMVLQENTCNANLIKHGAQLVSGIILGECCAGLWVRGW